jgi:glutathione S-transferase
MGLYTMSKRELDRLALIRRIVDRHISVVTASELMGLSRSQVHRLVAGYRQSGANTLISTRRGKPSNRGLPACAARTGIGACVGTLWRFWPHIVGDDFSVADITAFAGLAFAGFARVDVPADCANLKAWHHKVAQRPSIAD